MERGFLNFTVFLKSSLAKLVATQTLSEDFLCIEFWEEWQAEYYSAKFFDETNEGRPADHGDTEYYGVTDEFEPNQNELFSQSILANDVITRPTISQI